MNVAFKISQTEMMLNPLFGVRDISPLFLFLGAFIVTSATFTIASAGVPWSLARGEWSGAGVSLLFAGLSFWLARLAGRVCFHNGPRRFRYFVERECFELVRSGWRTRLARTSIKAMWPRIEVSRGGRKRASGVWLYLVLEHTTGKQTNFFLCCLPSLESAQGVEVRDLFGNLARVTGLPVGQPEIQEI